MTSAECDCEDDVDIYGDLPNEPCILDTVKELEETKRVLKEEVTRLKTKLVEITTERNELESKNKNLGLNISTLYKTASAEIERKDKLIAELRKEKDNIIFRRQNKSFSEEANHRPDDNDDFQGSQDVMGQNHHPAPAAEQTESHHSAPTIEQTEPTNVDTDSCASNKSSPHMYVPPDSVLTLFSQRRLRTMLKNNKVINFDKSIEDVNQESVIPWNLIPITDAEPHKDINKEVHNNSAHLNKEYGSFSQNGSDKKSSNSENYSYLPHTKSVGYAETKSDRIYTKMRDYSVNNYKNGSFTMTRKAVPRRYHQEYEHKSYSKYESVKYLCSENYRSRTYPRYAVPEYHSRSDRWQFYKIPRVTYATSLPRAVKSLRSWSRARSVSESSNVSGSEQNTAQRRYYSKVSSESRSPVLETAHKPTDLALKLADSDASTSHMKFTHDIEPHSVAGASGVELEQSLKTAKTKPVANIPVSPSAASKHGTVTTSLLNLSEHSSFKRSKRAKIVELNTEVKPSEARTPDLVKNTNIELFSEHNQNEGMKRTLETTEEDELHLPDTKRQVLNDITGRECYNYRENDNFTDHKQLYFDTARKQPSSASVNENMLKNNEVNEDRTDDIKNVNTTTLKEIKKSEEQKEETGHQNIKVDVGQPAVDNTGFKKETGSSTGIKYDSPKLKETDTNFANERMTDRCHGEHFKFRFDRKPFDTKRKTSDSRRPQYISHRYHERSRTPVTFNSHCKRRSPSELLNKDRAGRRLSNHDEMVRTERSRSRSSEGTSICREPEKYKISDTTDEKSARYLANMVTSEEKRKRNKYSKGDTKKSDCSQNYNKQGKHRLEVDGKKQNATSTKKEDCVINVNKMLLDITSDERVIKSQHHDDCGGQTESVRIESSRSATLNEKEKSGNEELQHEPSTIISVRPLNMNEIITNNISEQNQNYYPTSKSTQIRSRRNNHKRGSQVLIKTDNNISSDDADLIHEPCGINKVGCENKIRKSKELEDKNKQMCTSNSQNNENDDEKGQHSIEVEQVKLSNTKERMASGQDEEYDRNCQKENLLGNNSKDHVKKDDPKGQTVHDSTVNTENEKNRKTEFGNTKAGKKINTSTSKEEIKKIKCNSDKNVPENSQDYRRNKQMDGDHETEVCISEESKVNMKQASHHENVQENTLKKDDDKRVVKSTIQDVCQYTKQKPKVSASNKKQDSQFQDTLYGSPKEITAQSSVSIEANKVEKTNKTAVSSRSKHRKKEERVLEEFKVYETSNVKHKGYTTKKAAPEEIQNEKQCEETEKLPNGQKHRYRGKNEECGIELTQVDVDNAEEVRKHKEDNSSVFRRMQSGCMGQTESPADKMEDVTVGAINEYEKLNYKDSKHVLSKQPVLRFSVPDEISNSENDKETMLRLKINKQEGVTPRVSEKYRVLDSVDQKDSKQRSSKQKNHENEKNISNICQNYKTNKEEEQPPESSTSQTDVNDAEENEIRRKYKSSSKNVQQKSVCVKNTGDGVMKTKAHHGDIGYAIKSAVDRVNDTTPSAVHRNKISDCREFKHASPSLVAELPLTCNENEKVGIKKTRSRSYENGNDLMRGLEKHTVADSTDEKHVRRKTDSTEYSEETNANKYSVEDNKISSTSHNHENMMGKNEDCEVEFAQTDTQNIKHWDITSPENRSNENVQKIGIPESDNGHDDVQPETNNCTEAHLESVKSMNDVTPSEKEDSGCKEMQKGTCEEPVAEVSVSHEVNEESAVVISRKPSNNSANLSPASNRESPVINLKFRARRSTGVKLEDSQAVLSVNITPPKNETRVLILQGVGTSKVGNNSVSETHASTEEGNNRQNVNVLCNNGGNTMCKKVEEVSKGNGTDTFCSVSVGDNGTVDHKLKKKNITTKQLHETRNLHEVNIKTDLNLRTMCQSVVANYCHESDNTSKEWDFDICTSSDNSDENSDDSWSPKRKKTKKLKSQQNKPNGRKTRQNRKK